MTRKQKLLFNLIGFLGLLGLVILLAGAFHTATSNQLIDLKGRHLLAVEGYGARCIILFNSEGMGSAGSGAIQCNWYWPYLGDWRPVEVIGVNYRNMPYIIGSRRKK